MTPTFEGWYNEKHNKVDLNNIWKNGPAVYTKRLDGHFTNFGPISGTKENELKYYYDEVRVFVYLNQNGSEVETIEFVPWYDGEEVGNVKIPTWLENKVKEVLKDFPIPTFQYRTLFQ